MKTASFSALAVKIKVSSGETEKVGAAQGKIEDKKVRKFFFCQDVNRMRNILCLALIFIALLSQGCAKTYPGLPDLPVKDWLNPDEPRKIVQSEKYQIYSPDKEMTFDDLVWLAIQQSPVISKGQIDLEIQEINKTDAKWRYLPELHITYHITMNLTKKNEASQYKNQDYGDTTYELSFSGHYANPVATYFSNVAADEMLQTAIITQRKVIGGVIYNIARTMMDIWGLQKNIALIGKLIDHAEKSRDFQEERSQHIPDIVRPDLLARDNVRGLELELRERTMDLALARTRLKHLVGLDANQALKVNIDSVLPLIENFDPQQHTWIQGWQQAEDRYLAKQRIKLEKANIYLAWASYLPNINLGINESPGKGQYQPRDGESDQFLHLYIGMPILDWGHRLRMADLAEARQRQRRLDEIQNERDYREEWMKQEQQLFLADARLERAKHNASSAARRYETMEVAYDNGSATMQNLVDLKNAELRAQMGVVSTEQARYNQKLFMLHYMSGLVMHFLGEAGYQKD